MKWIGITGSWRVTDENVESDVRAAVRDSIDSGNGIVTGGALNVDSFALDEALRLDPAATRIRVCLPVTLERYAAHYRKRAEESVITREQAETLIAELTKFQRTNPEALLENRTNTTVDKTTYYERNTQVVDLSDELIAFQVNESRGVQDTINKALRAGKPVSVRRYTLLVSPRTNQAG